MNNKRYLEKIPSKYIIINIFEYIGYYKCVLKLFLYSKKLQKKFKINMRNYLEEYFDRIKFNVFDYFSYNYNQSLDLINYKDGNLRNNLEKDLIKHNINKNIFNRYLNDIIKNQPNYNNKLLDIYSPFFDLLIKDYDVLREIYIPMFMNLIKKQNVKNDYLNIFNKLKKENIKEISILFNYKTKEEFEFFKKITKNFNIKNFCLIKESDDDDDLDNQNIEEDAFKDYFSIHSRNNLDFLTINKNSSKKIISPIYLENVNNLTQLQLLSLDNLSFTDVFILKLKNLKILFLDNCQFITFEKDILLNIEILRVNNCFIKIPESKMKLPNVTNCHFLSKYFIIEDYFSIFDFSSITQVLNLTIGLNEFINLDVSLFKSLVFLTIEFNYYANDTYPKQKLNSDIIIMYNKIFSIKTLLWVDIPYIHVKDINKINGENKSVCALSIRTIKDFYSKVVKVNDIQKKFPNIKSLFIFYHFKDKVCVDINLNEKLLMIRLREIYDSHPGRDTVDLTIYRNNKKYLLKDS